MHGNEKEESETAYLPPRIVLDVAFRCLALIWEVTTRPIHIFVWHLCGEEFLDQDYYDAWVLNSMRSLVKWTVLITYSSVSSSTRPRNSDTVVWLLLFNCSGFVCSFNYFACLISYIYGKFTEYWSKENIIKRFLLLSKLTYGTSIIKWRRVREFWVYTGGNIRKWVLGKLSQKNFSMQSASDTRKKKIAKSLNLYMSGVDFCRSFFFFFLFCKPQLKASLTS